MKKPESATQNDFNEALDRYRSALTPEHFNTLSACALQPAPSAIRLNRLKVKEGWDLSSELSAKYGWTLRPMTFGRFHFNQVTEAANIAPGQTVEHQMGYFYLQDAASILPVSLFDPNTKPELTLDMAASPGGKTTQLIDSNLDAGLVIANDSSASRLQALRTVLDIWGGVNTASTNFPGEKWGMWYPETFDRILLDAPCSMESLRNSASHPHRPISCDERSRLAERQLALLSSALSAARIGAEIVYSTCSLAPEEDEMVVDALLRRFPNAVSVDQEQSRQFGTIGLESFGSIDLDPAVRGSLRVWPDRFNTNGFFAVKLTKLKAIDFPTELPPSRPFETTRYEESPEKLIRLADDQMRAKYGFDLSGGVYKRGQRIMLRGDELYSLPATWLERFSKLPYYTTGISLGKLLKEKFIPSVDLILRFGQDFQHGTMEIEDSQIGPWLRGLEIRNLSYPPGYEGDILAIRSREGLNLGAGKANPGRLRNLLPHRHLQLW